MPQAPLKTVRALALLALAVIAPRPACGAAGVVDPHLDSTLLRDGCRACHRGHGVSRSPMLPGSQLDTCLQCHGSLTSRNRQLDSRALAARGAPRLVGSALDLPHAHPMSPRAFSSHELGVVVCTSCHSPHRGIQGAPEGPSPPGRRRRSPKNPNRFEFELCESCHGNQGAMAQSLDDISRLLSPSNPSFHPVEAPAREASPSVIPPLAGREINCTDCHGNSDPNGPRGPHGSEEPFILKYRYATTDGSPESLETYRLCYTCHRRDVVLGSAAFDGHGRHITVYRASCATCHSPHGSVENRALIRFGEETLLAGVAPSVSAGRLAFVSDGPGSGKCFLTCHGRDHAPEVYGAMGFSFQPLLGGP